MNRATQTDDGRLLFWCPGCDCYHGVRTGAGGWTWNGSLETPTLTPSLLTKGEHTCHAFVTDGKIKYLGDCTHTLAGQTVELGDVEEMGGG